MLFEIGKKLISRSVLPGPLAVVATVAELAVVARAVTKALAEEDEEDER